MPSVGRVSYPLFRFYVLRASSFSSHPLKERPRCAPELGYSTAVEPASSTPSVLFATQSPRPTHRDTRPRVGSTRRANSDPGSAGGVEASATYLSLARGTRTQ